LKEDSARGSAGKRTGVTRSALVIVETALALVLLVGAGLLNFTHGLPLKGSRRTTSAELLFLRTAPLDSRGIGR
jgi:hypothetical protein